MNRLSMPQQIKVNNMMDKSEVSAQNVKFFFLISGVVYIDHNLLMVYFPSTNLVLGKAALFKN